MDGLNSFSLGSVKKYKKSQLNQYLLLLSMPSWLATVTVICFICSIIITHLLHNRDLLSSIAMTSILVPIFVIGVLLIIVSVFFYHIQESVCWKTLSLESADDAPESFKRAIAEADGLLSIVGITPAGGCACGLSELHSKWYVDNLIIGDRVVDSFLLLKIGKQEFYLEVQNVSKAFDHLTF